MRRQGNINIVPVAMEFWNGTVGGIIGAIKRLLGDRKRLVGVGKNKQKAYSRAIAKKNIYTKQQGRPGGKEKKKFWWSGAVG